MQSLWLKNAALSLLIFRILAGTRGSDGSRRSVVFDITAAAQLAKHFLEGPMWPNIMAYSSPGHDNDDIQELAMPQ